MMRCWKRRSLRFAVLSALLVALCCIPFQAFTQTQVQDVDGTIQEQPAEPQTRAQKEKERFLNPFDETDFPWERPSIVTQALTLSLLSLAPFIIMLLTSFAKIAIVLSLLRNALGTQQAPPNQVINGIALLLTLYIMFPTGLKMYEAAEPVLKKNPPTELTTAESSAFVVEVLAAAREPFRDFLIRNTDVAHMKRFYRMSYGIIPKEYRSSLKLDDFIVVIPAFITSQLKDAFEVGVLIYIPFFVIDLVTSNILLAMGMMMLSPMTISLPLKLFLLVMLDGWTLLITGLVQTYA